MASPSPQHRFSLEDLHTAIDQIARVVSPHKTIVIVGSQAMLASIPPEKWEEAAGVEHSHDIDLFCIPEMGIDQREHINNAFAEDSNFASEHGWNIEPVGEWVMMTSLPEWPDRMLQINTPTGNTGYCISPLDIIFNKAEAGRDKDTEYIWDAINAGLIKPSQIAQAIQKYENQLSPGTAERVNKTMQKVVNAILKEKEPTPKKPEEPTIE